MPQDKLPEIKKIATAVQEAVSSATTVKDESPVVREDDKPKEPRQVLAPTPELNPRNQAMREIVEEAVAKREVDAKESIPVGDTDREHLIADEASEPPQVVPDEPAATEAAPAAPAAPEGFNPDSEYDLLVDGKTVKVKGSQIIDSGRRTLQKETAADYKLELASKLLTEAQQRVQAQQPPPQGVAPTAPQPQAPSAPSYLDLAQVIQFGTTEQAAQAMAEFERQVSSKAAKQEDIQRLISQVLPHAINQQSSFQKAVEFVQSEYGDLLADPYLKPLFFMKEQEAMKAGDPRAKKDLYQSIGEDIRKHFNRPKVGAPATPAPTIEQRREAKAAAPAAPKLASVRLVGSSEQPKPKTTEEIIEGMRAARGQVSLR